MLMLMLLGFSFISGFTVLFSVYRHLLLTLIGLEFVMVSIYLLMFMSFVVVDLELYFMSFFMIMMVCEGALGLSVLVTLIRSHGNDMVGSLYLVLW